MTTYTCLTCGKPYEMGEEHACEMPSSEWLVSQEGHGAGRWIVHRPGGNRPHKIARFDNREEAEDCARKVSAAMNEILSTYLPQADPVKTTEVVTGPAREVVT